MEFPRKPRYYQSIKTSHNFLIIEHITTFPISPIEVIKKHQWGLITYSELAEIHGVTLDEVCKTFGSEDGFTIYDKDNYTIAYNDSVQSEERIRFTLMHEIGHVYLNHLVDFDETILRRSRLTKDKYKLLESESNVFVRNVLAPALLVKKLGYEQSISNIMTSFCISSAAAIMRCRFLNNDLYYLQNINCTLELSNFESFISEARNTWFCSSCYHNFVCENPFFCPICGADTIYNYGGVSRFMKYNGYDLDENGLPHICPICGNEEMDGGSYCKICGTQIQNKCTSVERDWDGNIEYECGRPASGNARYCTACGAKTTYYKQGLLKDWKEEKQEGFTLNYGLIP